MAQTKKKSTSKKTVRRTRQTAIQKRNKHVASVILFFFAVLSFFFFIVKGDHFWTALHNFWHGVFGNLFGLPLSVALGYIAIICAKEYDIKYIRNKSILLASGLLILSSAIDIFCINEPSFGEHVAKIYSQSWWSGGVLGTLLGYPVYSIFGKVGGSIILIISSLVYLLLVTRTPLMNFLNTVSAPAKKIAEVADRTHEHIVTAQQQKKEAFDINNTTFAANLDIPVAGEVRQEPEKKEAELLTRDVINKRAKKVVTAYLDSDKEDDIDIDIPVNRKSAPAKTRKSGVTKELLEQINSDNIEIVSDDDPSKRSIPNIIQRAEPVKEGVTEIPEYKFPPISLLKRAPRQSTADIKNELQANAEKLVDTLRSFGVETRVIDVSRGPAVTRYELQPAAGVRVSKIANLADDISLNLATTGVRIEAPIPGKPAVGIEVPNKIRSSVGFRELIESDGFEESKSKLTCAIGKDITGNITYMDVAKMPHILIAGTTGSGKSVCMNSIIMSILYKAKPDEVKMIMIDPKAVELTNYNGIPHLLVPVVTDPRKAAGTLGWAVSEMLQRYKKLQECGAKNIEAYNRLAEKNNGYEFMPQVVIFIDELADLMMAAPKEVEDSICRLAQMARAAGMHLVIATQRPSVDVITGLIKANIPSRIALTTANQIDSRTILDSAGAEKLIGKGDMLYNPVGVNKPTRVQGCWVSDDEIEAVVDFLKRKSSPSYDDNVIEEINRQAENVKGKGGSVSAQSGDGEISGEQDAMLSAAMEVVVTAGQASTSLLQRKLKLGYARAARIMDQLEEAGIIGPFEGAKPRKVLMSKQELLEMQAMSE